MATPYFYPHWSPNGNYSEFPDFDFSELLSLLFSWAAVDIYQLLSMCCDRDYGGHKINGFPAHIDPLAQEFS